MRQPQRSRQQWLSIFKQQQHSGMTAAEFCSEHAINLQTFYARRSDIRLQTQRSRFVKVEREVTTVEHTSSENLMLNMGGTQLTLPSSTDVNWLASLIKALA